MELLPPIPRWEEIQEAVGAVENIELLAETHKNTLYKLKTAGGTFVVKYSRRGWAEYEYHSMKRLREEGYAVPEPFNFFETEEEEGKSRYGTLKKVPGILVFEFIDGPSMLDLMSEELVKKTADVIKKIHQDPRHKRDQPFIKNYSEIEVERMQYHFEKKEATFADLKSELEQLSGEYVQHEIEYTTIHGDFRPSNILVKNGELYLIDFEGTCEGGDPLKDVGTFYGETLINHPKYAEIFRESYGTEMTVPLKFHTIRRLLVLAAFEDIDCSFVKEKIEDVLRK
ncbi:MAG: aminoglycoside phosphotransferase family protein [Candidatus Altiarchaeota archaeon]|nr:aminoglycoside phosphotransferase family protein [Candidatus Altiarchaeota archaeon]